MKLKLSETNRTLINRCLDRLEETYRNNVYSVATQQIPYLHQARENNLTLFLVKLIEINKHIKENYPRVDDFQISKDELSYIKRAILAYRKDEADSIERQKEKSNNSNLSLGLDSILNPIDSLLQQNWLKHIEPIEIPNLSDFITVSSIDKFHARTLEIAEREYDEKFHILQSPKLFIKDLEYFRKICQTRKCSMIVAYLDIDNFKEFNTKYGEVEIDRKVLPKFMQALESHIFHHGFAYRYGGDEYVIILANVFPEVAIEFLKSLQIKIKNLKYQDVKESITVSIGFCNILPDCHLTSRTLEKKANEAKNFAKSKGKNCISTYDSPTFEEKGLYIIEK